MNDVSVALISWNEKQTLDLCLKSLVDFADEIILVDTGSFDGTIKKAKRLYENLGITGKIISEKTRSLGEARFIAVKNCTYNWILLSDSNMVYGENIKKDFQKIIQTRKQAAMASLNLMGDYSHVFSPKPMNSHHLTLFMKDDVKWGNMVDRPTAKSRHMRKLKSWSVNLSRVRPAWRYWYRGEPFDPSNRDESGWKTSSNRQYHWTKQVEYPSIMEYVEHEENMTLEQVKSVAPRWMLKMLQSHAKPLSTKQQHLLPETIKEEQKNPRYKLAYEGDTIIGRQPTL